ncbi:F-box/kelch-repeat protein [Actinidia chinensis var. chinensis]|uniref:F-box/kelch-repeat protein n=1 Tax=Actinidia chinensis var. chinensis TaxID=1590841 RepID=A0A2R6S099_ACTCC|nr:F-box/kelch-repeat protein [Actinidia chinensis var. chinensis]
MAIESDSTRRESERKKKKKKKTNQSPIDSQPLPSLPPEIIAEILSRLPVKSLLQFRSVSKSWLSLISNHEFAKTHLGIASKNDDYAHHRLILSSVRPQFDLKSCSLYSVLYEQEQQSLIASELDYPLKDPHRSFSVVGSCNGLVCIAIEEDAVFLWNPCTRKSKRLPDSRVRMKYGCYVIYGFGCDESSDDYKVVVILCFLGSGGLYETKVKVYALRTNSWRRIGDFSYGIPLDDSGKFVNGSLHWAASGNLGANYSWVIVSLDLAKETYGEVEQPNYGDGGLDLSLWELKGWLCVLCNYPGTHVDVWVMKETYGEVEQPNYGDGGLDLSLWELKGWLCVLCNYPGTHVDVWVMKEYGVRESWTKLFVISYLPEPSNDGFSRPLCISKNGEILLQYGSQLVLYNPKDGTSKILDIQNIYDFLESDTYVESLVSPNAVQRQH